MGFAPMYKGFAVPAIRLLWYPTNDRLYYTSDSGV